MALFPSRRHFMRALFLSLGIVLLGLLGCGTEVTLEPLGTPGPGPSWTPQEAIAVIEDKPRFAKDAAWNAEFDPYLGSWRVSLIYQVRLLYPPRDERRAMIWHVYEDTGLVEGPFD